MPEYDWGPPGWQALDPALMGAVRQPQMPVPDPSARPLRLPVQPKLRIQGQPQPQSNWDGGLSGVTPDLASLYAGLNMGMERDDSQVPVRVEGPAPPPIRVVPGSASWAAPDPASLAKGFESFYKAGSPPPLPMAPPSENIANLMAADVDPLTGATALNPRLRMVTHFQSRVDPNAVMPDLPGQHRAQAQALFGMVTGDQTKRLTEQNRNATELEKARLEGQGRLDIARMQMALPKHQAFYKWLNDNPNAKEADVNAAAQNFATAERAMGSSRLTGTPGGLTPPGLPGTPGGAGPNSPWDAALGGGGAGKPTPTYDQNVESMNLRKARDARLGELKTFIADQKWDAEKFGTELSRGGVLDSPEHARLLAQTLRERGFGGKSAQAIQDDMERELIRHARQVAPVGGSYLDRVRQNLTGPTGDVPTGGGLTVRFESRGDRQPRQVRILGADGQPVGVPRGYDLSAAPLASVMTGMANVVPNFSQKADDADTQKMKVWGQMLKALYAYQPPR